MDSKKIMKIVGTIGIVVAGVYIGQMVYNRYPPKKTKITTATTNGS